MSETKMTAGEGAGRATLIAFTAAIFTSAFLLFAVQPMFTKMVLPQLGGSPAVWSVAMVFFQALLLAGYLYAHISTKYLSTRSAAILHLGMMALTAITLPIAVSGQFGTPPEEGQAIWLIGVFLVSVGLPFFAVAGNGPLLQAWFSRSGHAHAHDPYFLYGASNLGSFAALLLYPVLIEPLLPVKAQSIGWAIGYTILIALISLAIVSIRHAGPTRAETIEAATPAPNARTILGWIALSFVPSGLLVAVTAHISTDVAAAPFLWVMPLALFLLTFVLIFRDKPLIPIRFVERILPILAAGLLLFSYFGAHMFVAVLLVHTGFFLAATLVCHSRLYASRPEAAYLTSFYLWMSFGGVLGGLFAALLAPVVFDRIVEYPLLVIASLLALPAIGVATRRDLLRQVLPVLVLGGAFLGVLYLIRVVHQGELGTTPHLVFLGATAATMFAYRRPLIVVAMLPMLFIALDTIQTMENRREHVRSFYGVHKLELREGGQIRVLTHGTTIHGAVRIVNPDGTAFTGRPRPLTYYHPEAPIAESLRAVPERAGGRALGVVGLGAGAHACNGTNADRWTFFEIDAAVVRIARDPKLFRFLSDCAPAARIVVGDARLTLAAEKPASFDNLLIDAFSSDAIPLHLMTREALALYLSKITENGILTMHISNRHLELQSVVAALARDAGVTALYKADPGEGKSTLDARIGSMVVAIAKNPEALKPLADVPGWRPITDRGIAPWTDDFSNIVGALWRNYAR
jgi:hypothetical protein